MFQLKYELNPGCGRVCDEKSLTTLHLKAEGPNDTLHYLWDFVGNPSVLLAVTSPAAKLNIEWDKYLTRQPKSINFTEEPIYTFGLVIQKVCTLIYIIKRTRKILWSVYMTKLLFMVKLKNLKIL